MRKYVVISADQNPDYLYYLPLTIWAWEKIGWEVIVFYRGDLFSNHYTDLVLSKHEICYDLDPIEGIRNATIAQVSRLYAGTLIGLDDNDIVMTADADMLPLSDYWHPDPNKITVYGEDLTGYTEYPICYVSMVKSRWVEVMGLSGGYDKMIKRDILANPNSKSEDFYKWWGIDQQIITQRIKAVNFEKDFIKRGQYQNGYAYGRVDRGSWTLNHKEYIDAHLFHQLYHKGNEDKFEKTLDLLEKIWPEENFDWFVLYTEEFKKLTGHK